MSYKAVTGFNYPDDAKPGAEIRVEAGTVLNVLPPKYAAAIKELGCVEELGAAPIEPEPEEDNGG